MTLLEGLIGKYYRVIRLKTNDKIILLSRGIMPKAVFKITHKICFNHLIIITNEEITIALRGSMASLIEVEPCSY